MTDSSHNPDTPHLLVTGGSGLLGATFVAMAAEQFQVTSLYHSHAVHWPGTQSISIDLSSDASIRTLISTVQPIAIFHFAAATNVDRCEADQDYAYQTNVALTERLARAAAEAGVKFVFMSTDSVFDGIRGHYDETDAPNPVNVYAESKLKAEAVVRSSGGDYLIVRGNIYGWNAQPKQSLAEWILARLENGQTVPAFTDVQFTPLLVNTLAELLLRLLSCEARGIWHLGSTDELSKFDFAVGVAQAFGYPTSGIIPTILAQSPLKARRPLNTTLDSGAAAARFGLSLPTVMSDLRRLHDLRESGFLKRLKQATQQA